MCGVEERDAFPGRPARGIKYALGDPLPGYGEADSVGVSGDATRLAVAWRRGDGLPQTDEWISLRFVMSNAKLYSFWAE